MTPLDHLRTALERVEKATGPNATLDEFISNTIGWWGDEKRAARVYVGAETRPRWTASLDAVVALVEREMPCQWEVNGSGYAQIRIGRRYYHGDVADYPALALLAAFLRARIAEMEAEDVA